MPTARSDRNGRRVTPVETSAAEAAQSPAISTSLRLPPFQFRFLWATVLLTSTATSLFTAIVMTVYVVAISVRGGYLIEISGLLPVHQIPIVAAAYGAFSLWFSKIACQIMYASVRSRRLVFVIHTKQNQDPQPQPQPSTLGPLSVLHRVHNMWLDLFRGNGPFDISPTTFELLFLVREVIEVTTQSYQAYKCSLLISQRWINNFYVGTLALNCWIAPLIHWRSSHYPAMQRFLYLCSDVALDLAATLVVPLSIIFSAVLGILMDNVSMASGDMEYAFDVPYDDVFFFNVVKAVRQVFVSTWLDFVTKMLPLLSMATCLGQIIRHVRPASTRVSISSMPRSSSSVSLRTISTMRRVAIVSLAKKMSARRLRTGTALSSLFPSFIRPDSTPLQWLQRCRFTRSLVSVRSVHTLFFLWGVAIVAIHLDANRASHLAPPREMLGSCKASSQPWFVTKFSCTVLEINCHRHGFSGAAAEIASGLALVDADGITSLLLSHCPLLHMPRELQSLNNMLMLELSNCTVVEWTADAALVDSKHSRLQFLNMNRVNFSTGLLPEGLHSTPFPHKLRDITIAATNLRTLPQDLHTKWTRLLNLYLERTPWQSLPATLAHMNPARLSLLGSPITEIQDDYFSRDASFQVLSVARTKLTQWPASIGRVDALYLLLMDYTPIETLPVWLLAEGERRRHQDVNSHITVSAGGSAFCRKAYDGKKLPGLVVVCREKADQEIEASPLTVMQRTRQP